LPAVKGNSAKSIMKLSTLHTCTEQVNYASLHYVLRALIKFLWRKSR